MIEYRIITLRLSKAVLKINDLIVPDMFDGWINTKQHYLEVDFNAQGYNYGFDFEWRCSAGETSILDELKFDKTLLVLTSFRDTNPSMNTFNDLEPFKITWENNRPQIKPYKMIFGAEISDERYIKRNNRASSFDSCFLNINNEIFLVGGGKNSYQVSKMNGREFEYLSLALPIPSYYGLCSQPTFQSAIICGYQGKKSCFTFDGRKFGQVSETSSQSHSNAVSTYFQSEMVLISTHSIESLSISTNELSKWRDFPGIVGSDMVRFGSAVSIENQIFVFGGQFSNLDVSDLVHRYRYNKWNEFQKMAKPKLNIYSVLVTEKAIMHLEFERLDFLERWIYDNESDSFFVEDFASSNMQSELTISTDKTITYSRPLLTVIQSNQSSLSFWSDWSKSSAYEDHLFARTRCRGETLDCETQLKNMTDTKSLLIIGSDHRINKEEGQIDIGPHAMLVQLPLANLKTKEFGFFRMPQEISFSWSHVRYSSTATLNGVMFLFGSSAEIHQRDIAIVRNCGFEMYFNDGQQIKFAGLDYSNSLVENFEGE